LELLPGAHAGLGVSGAALNLGRLVGLIIDFLLGRVLASLGIVVERDADGAAVVAVVLTDDLLGVQLPQARIVVAAGRHEVGAIGAEGAVPDPALVTRQGGFEWKGARLGVRTSRLHLFNLPDLGGMVGATGCELLDVGRKEDTSNIFLVCREVGHWDKLGALESLYKLPDKDVTRIVGCTEKSAVSRNRDTRHRDLFLGNELVGAGILSQIPETNAAAPITADNLALVRMDNDIIDGGPMIVAPLDHTGARVPDFDSAVLGARDHPFAIAVECHARDVARVALKDGGGSGVRRANVEQLYCVISSSGEVALVGGDAESVDLGIGMLNGSGADSREGLPKPEKSVSYMPQLMRPFKLCWALGPDALQEDGAYLMVWS
jgi:hypothetical protein